MSAFTLAEMYTTIHRRTGVIARTLQNPELAASPADNQALLDYIEEAGELACRHIPQFENRQRWVLTVGQGCYDLSCAVLTPRQCKISGAGFDLVLGDIHNVRDCSDNEANGTPTQFAVNGLELWIAPAPATTGELIFYYRTSSIIGSVETEKETDEDPELDIIEHVPRSWRKPLEHYAIAMWLTENGAAESAEMYSAKWAEFLASEQTDRRGASVASRTPSYLS